MLEAFDLHNVLIDLETLSRAAKEDFDAEHWATYSDYISEFNRLLNAVQKADLGLDIDPVQIVPEEKLAYGYGAGVGTPAERAKLRELVNKSSRLLARITSSQSSSSQQNSDPVLSVERVCSRFHAVARQLRSRREGRKTLEIEDEYDVQDLFHALLKIFFDDMRPEEWTPSYAGGSSRMDFLLKSEQIVVEIKKTSKNLSDRHLGEQLLVDIAKYKEHPNCKTLVCFAYDPEGRIANPRGVEDDLMSKNDGSTQVFVFIRPTGD